MKKININEIKEEPWQSPKGKYAVAFKGISEALGRGRTRESGHRVSGDFEERHPFDLEWSRMPPGKPNFPFHCALGAVGNVFDRERQSIRAP